MRQKRREFIRSSTLSVGAALFFNDLYKKLADEIPNELHSGTMNLSYRPYMLEMKHVFTLAVHSRKTTPVILTEIEYNGIIGYGEASVPPYLGESQDSVQRFLSKIDLSKYKNPFELENIITDIDKIESGNCAAKASVDIALHDLVGKLIGQPWFRIWGFEKDKAPYTSFTIGIDKPDIVREKTKEAAEYKILKVKLGLDTDKEMIKTIRSVTDKPITADVNQGWIDKEKALEMLYWLKEQNVVMIEQPLPKERIDDLAWLSERSPIPIIGDEGVQRVSDVKKAVGVYNGINIKLMKCGGMREAHKMLLLAHSLGLKVMIGCMTETSCAISAASHLSPMVDWADLDGALLIKNDIFDGTKIIGGKITLIDRPGIGAIPKTAEK